MCDWGGGPNEVKNGGYNRTYEEPQPRTIKCLRYMPEKDFIGSKSYTCDMPIEGFIGSITYWEWDAAAKKHFAEFHSN